MKFNFFKYLFLLPAFILALQSCRNDDNESAGNINIEIKELGHHDTHGGGVVHAGEELHLDAEITTTNKIDKINVNIAKKNNSETKIVNQDFTDYKGQLSADFHKHIDIPANTSAGNYEVIITVTDLKGITKTETADLKIEESISELIKIELEEIGHNGHGHIGEALSVKAHIDTKNPIAEITLEIHNEKNSNEKVSQSFSSYNGKTHAHFEGSINIPATFTAGEYHLHIVVKDSKGIEREVGKDIELVKH